jgi:hypothetical protein
VKEMFFAAFASDVSQDIWFVQCPGPAISCIYKFFLSIFLFMIGFHFYPKGGEARGFSETLVTC